MGIKCVQPKYDLLLINRYSTVLILICIFQNKLITTYMCINTCLPKNWNPTHVRLPKQRKRKEYLVKRIKISLKSEKWPPPPPHLYSLWKWPIWDNFNPSLNPLKHQFSLTSYSFSACFYYLLNMKSLTHVKKIIEWSSCIYLSSLIFFSSFIFLFVLH